jgi:hypothetical protein
MVAGHVACMEETRMHTKIYSENLKGSDSLGDLGIDGKITLNGS